MSWWSLLCALAICILASSCAAAKQERKLHRLVGGHFRIHSSEDDAELLTALSSGSKNKKSQKSDDEEKKTLSQQVADGKYGLIQKELFAKPSKRPGVLSYDNNPEVPKDNINNLGGLTKNEIWLAENHLLVLKGGTYPPHDAKTETTPWPPIDDFKAPRRPVKIPSHPKVPPPFPVQLTDDGPLQILGTNSSRTLNGTFHEGTYAVPAPDGYDAGPSGPFFLPPDGPYPANFTTGQAPIPVPAYPPGDYFPGVPFPPYPNLNGTLPPFFASLPPGAAILPPPPTNQTEPYDEDDPSIYYPPPYSFYYQKDNSSAVPAGPLVPGIILPPPPNFFAPLEETTTRTRIRIKTTTTPLPQIHPTTTPVPPTSVLNTRKPPIRVHYVPSEINNELKPVVVTTTTPTPPPPKVITIVPVRQQPTKTRTQPTRTQNTRPPSVTVLKPVKQRQQNVYVYEDNEIVTNPPQQPRQQFAVYGPQQARVKTIISTTQVPLRVYYSTANDIETNSITQPPEKYHIANTNRQKTTTTTKAPAQYYFYEEQADYESTTTRKPLQHFYEIPNEYYAKPPSPPPQKYIYVTARPYKTQRPRYRFVQQTPKTDTFSIHIARLQKQIAQYYTTPRPNYSPKPVYQFSFQASNYRPPAPPTDENDKFRPLPKYSVQIQPAIEIIPTELPLQQQQNYRYQSSSERPAPSQYYNTPRPDYDYEENNHQKVPPRGPQYEATPNPIYQGFYTKPDEGFFDENTKQYFSTFGKKLPTATTPLPPPQKQRQPSPQQQQHYQQQQQQKPVSLEGDTAVNYLPPRPTVNPDAEFVPLNPPNRQRVNYPQVVKYRQYAEESRQKNREVPTAEGQSGSFISYQLPGDDGAHFYFLTPQLAQSREQGAGYYYSQPNVARIRRSKER